MPSINIAAQSLLRLSMDSVDEAERAKPARDPLVTPPLQVERWSPSRRGLVGAAMVGFGLLALPPRIRAEPMAAPVSALAFDQDALLFAHRNLSRSEDGGASWTMLPGPGEILALATHPQRPGRIIAGLASGGVAISEDGGRTWSRRASGLPGAAVASITTAAAQPDLLYAALQGDGLWKSEDAGRTWSFAMDRPWLADAERDLLALASVNLATGMGGIWIYAGTEKGLTRLPDCFCRWQDVQPGNAMDALVAGDPAPSSSPLPAGEPVHDLVSAPSSPEALYAALDSGVWASRDAGVVWARIAQGRASAVAVHPANRNHVTAALDGALKQSVDGGASWSPLAVV